MSRAPQERIAPYRRRMGWSVPWYTVVGPGFQRLTLDAPAAAGTTEGLHTAPAGVREALARVAPGGPSFDLLEFRATSGVDAARGDRLLDLAPAIAEKPDAVPLPGVPGRVEFGKDYKMKRRIVVVPQEGFLFSGTIRDNLLVGRPDAADEDVASAIDVLGLRPRFDAFPGGLDAQVRERGANFSAGERQLVSLVRAALADPGVLVLDEATSSLDPGTGLVVEAAGGRMAEPIRRRPWGLRDFRVVDPDGRPVPGAVVTCVARPPSAGMTKIFRSPSRYEWNAISAPSGENCGRKSSHASRVSDCTAPPPSGMRKRCWLPSRFESNASQRPSVLTSNPSITCWSRVSCLSPASPAGAPGSGSDQTFTVSTNVE